MLSKGRMLLPFEARRDHYFAITFDLPTAIHVAVLVLVVALPLVLLRQYVRLWHVPGPFWARWSNLPRFFWVLSRRAHEIHIELHEKHGKLVRMGPNMVSVGDPAEIRNIYGITDKFKKVGGPS